MAKKEKKDELKQALEEAASKAVKSDTKKSKEEYLQEFKETHAEFRKRRKRFVRVKGGSDIYTEDVETKLESERRAKTDVSKSVQRLTFIYRMKQQQKKNGRNLDIASFDKGIVRIIKTDPKYGLCAICDFGPEHDCVQVLIPFNKFTDKTEEELLSELRVNAHTFLSRRLNTTVDFCIEGYQAPTEESPAYFIGNRVEAMKDKCALFWYGIEVDRGSESYRFNEGSIIEARIVGVYPKAGVMIEVFGIEYLVPQREVDWTHFKDIRDLSHIKLGGTVLVKIMSLKRSEDKIDVSYTASIKEAKPNPMERALKIYSPGDEVTGEVSMVRWNEQNMNKSTCIVKIPHNAEVFCMYPPMGVRSGQKVTVVIGEVRGRNARGIPFMHAKITHVEEDNLDDHLLTL